MDYICAPLGYLMKWCWDLFADYGLAIIFFTLLTKFVLLPVSIWVHKNSIKMVKIQPEINRLKAKYYGDRELFAEEENKLHKKVHYNPFTSLIPLILQIILLMAVLYIVKEPLTHILHLSDDICRELAGVIGGDFREDQLAIVRAVLNGRFDSAALSAGAADAISLISTLKIDFLGVSLDVIPSSVWGLYLLVPVAAALSSLLLCYVQNKANVLQAEQSKWNKYGMTALSVALSLYLGCFVYTGVALYWIASNLFAVLQQFILNACINPKKYVDYEALEASREELRKIESLDKKTVKDEAYYRNRKREKQDYKKFFTVLNKHLVIYSERSGFYKYFEALIEGLLKRSNLIIHYITNDPDDQIFALAEKEPRIRPYYIGQKKMIPLMLKMDADLVVMTTPDLETYYIKRSLVRKDVEYIYVPHDMMSAHMSFRKGAFDHFDTVFCAGPHIERELRATEAYYRTPEKTMVPFGYPLAEKLEASFEAMPKEAHERKEILIAPSWQEDNLLDSVVDELITRLKGNGNHLTVRPHPEYVKRYGEKIRQLTERYADVPAEELTFELDFSSNRSIYASDLLITDWSGIAYEFSFATKRPVLFVNTKIKSENPEWPVIQMEPVEITLRSQVGVALEKNELANVRSVVDELLENREKYQAKIQEIQNNHIYSYGTNGSIGVKYILNRLSEIQKSKKN